MPFLKLKFPNQAPSGDFRYPRPDGSFIYGGDLRDLTTKIVEYRVLNGLPLGDPEAEAQDWLCRNSNALCVPANPAKKMPGVKANGGMVARFIYAMLEWMRNGGHVDQAQAESRGERCSVCRFNVSIDDVNCLGCFGIFSKIAQIIGNRKTRLDDSLQFCGHCGCSLKVVVFTPMEILDRAHPNADFPEDTGQTENGAPITCWRKAYADSQKQA